MFKRINSFKMSVFESFVKKKKMKKDIWKKKHTHTI